MKKCFSLLLTLAMMLSMVPAVGATEIADVAEPETTVEETVSAETLIRRAEADVRAEEARSEANAARTEDLVLDEIMDLPEADTLDATTYYDVTIKVTFPGKGNGSVRAYLYSPAAVDETGKVLTEPSARSQSVYMENSNTVTMKLSVPAGDYIPAVQSYAGGTGAYTRQTVYFNADGTMATNAYTAEPMKITGAKTINITMPKAERIISGTVKFSTALTEDTWFQLYASSNSSFSSTYASYEIEAAKGAKSFDFSIGVPANSYSLEFESYTENSYGKWGYYDLYGNTSNDYDNRAYVSVYNESVTGLIINGDYLLEKVEEEEWDGVEVQVTAKLPETLTIWDEYMILLYNEYGDLYDYNWVNANKGTSAIETSFYIEKDMKFKVAYTQAANANFNWNDDFVAIRYQGEKGITSLLDNAKVYTAEGETMTVTIDDTSNYKVTGTLKLESPTTRNYEAAYVLAEFADGEIFGARVSYWSGDSSADYTIYIPKTMSGTFSAYGARALNSNRMVILPDSVTTPKSYELANRTLTDITLPDPEPNVTGTVSLPNGMKAPKGGLALRFSVANNNVGYYYMAEGKSSVNFAFAVPLTEESWDQEKPVQVTVMNPPANLFDSYTIYRPIEAMTDLSLVIPEAVTVSGTITVPEAARTLGTTFRVRSYNYNEDNDSISNSAYVTTLPGQTSATYSLKVFKDNNVQLRIQVNIDATGKVLSTTQYLQADGTFGTKSTQISLTEDTTANCAFAQGKTITGKITLASGLSSSYYNGSVYAQPTSGGNHYYGSFYFEGTEGTYSVAVPYEYEGTYRVYYSAYSEDPNALTGTEIYYAGPGSMTTNADSAAPVTATEEGTQVDLVILKAKTVSGTVSLADGLPEGPYYGNVYAMDDSDRLYSCYFDFSDGRKDYSIKLPTDYKGTWRLAIRVNYNAEEKPDNLLTGTYLYLTESGYTTNPDAEDVKKFTIGADGLVQDMVIPEADIFTLTLKAPSGFSGNYSGRAYLVNKSSDESEYAEFSFTGTSGTLTFPVLKGDTSNYILEVRVSSGPGAMTNQYYYYANGGWVKNESDASTFKVSTDLSVSLPAGKTITGKLVAADGSAINLGQTDGDSCGSISLSPINGSYLSVSSFVNSDGTFSITYPDDATGNYRLYFSPYTNNLGCNVLSQSYYYVSGASASCIDYENATGIDISSDVAPLTIYVDTGWVLTGNIKLGEGVTLSSPYDGGSVGSVRMSLRQNVEEDSYYESRYVYLYKDQTTFPYSIVVPKTAATYTVTAEKVDLEDNTTSNMYTGAYPAQTVSVSGSTTLSDVVLTKAKGTIKATVTMPKNDSTNVTVYVVVGENTYSEDVYLYGNNSNNKTKTVSVTLPESETGTQYKMYYYASYGEGILSRTDIYVAQDGTLTRDESLAGVFDMATAATQKFTLMEIPPYATGKIYIPDCVDDENFTVRLYGYSSSKDFTVSSSTMQTDTDGRKYIPYALTYQNVSAGYTYALQYCLRSYEGTELYFKSTNSSDRAYVTPSGDIAYKYDDSNYFTIPESGTTELDFTLATWDDGSEENIFQSAHGNPSYSSLPTYTYTYPGATALSVTFSKRTDTNLTINGKTYYYSDINYGYPVTIDVSDTNGVMTIEAYNGTGKNVYGFGIISIVPMYSSAAPTAPAITSVYTDNGSTDAIVMTDLLAGETVRVSLAGPKDTTGILISAIYDASGKMLEMNMDSLTFTEYSASTALDFEFAKDAAKLQIMLLDNTTSIIPQMAARVITG